MQRVDLRFSRWFAELNADRDARGGILLGGSAKKRQGAAIAAAQAAWADYKHAKSRGTRTERNTKWR